MSGRLNPTSLVRNAVAVLRQHFADPSYFAERFRASPRMADRIRRSKERLARLDRVGPVYPLRLPPSLFPSFLVLALGGALIGATWNVSRAASFWDQVLPISGSMMAIAGIDGLSRWFVMTCRLIHGAGEALKLTFWAMMVAVAVAAHEKAAAFPLGYICSYELIIVASRWKGRGRTG